MHRFFVGPEQIQGDTAVIIGDDAHHIHRVLRLMSGEEVTLCDGQGMDYHAVIQTADKGLVEVKVLNSNPSDTEPKTRVTLLQGLPKSAKMETIIQKCVELGIYDIQPVTTLRTVVRIADDRDGEKKTQRWQRISEEAAKQSKRGRIPRVWTPAPLHQAIGSCQADLKLILWEEEKNQSLRQALHRQETSPKSVAVLVGPEGGLDESEVELVIQHGWIPTTIGNRILRTETAGMAVLAAIMYHLGEWE